MKLMTKIDALFKAINTYNFYYSGDKIISNCPIHAGDNSSAFNINIDKDSQYYGRWFCNTRQCHRRFRNDVLGLVQAVWCEGDEANLSDPRNSFSEVCNWVRAFTTDVSGEFVVNQDDAVTKFLLSHNENAVEKTSLSRGEIRSRLEIPSQHYLSRGFSEGVLDEFDIGLCTREGSQMYNRVVFPVYDDDGKYMVGCVGRRTDNIPDGKWINSKGFNKSLHLYNYNRARGRVKDRKAIILVEGQGDVLRMYEAGIINTVGLFGCSLSSNQEFILQKSGAWDIVIATDNDDAGRMGFELIKEKLRHLFNIHQLIIPTKDLGDLTVAEINSEIKPQIKKFI